MVSDLEQIHRREDGTCHERGFDRRLRVTAEEGREATVTQHDDDRGVVDVALRERCGRIARGGIQNLHRRRAVERHRLPRARQHYRDAAPGCIGHEPVERDVLERDAGVDDGPDGETIQDLDQAGDVVLVRMAQDDEVDPPLMKGQIC